MKNQIFGNLKKEILKKIDAVNVCTALMKIHSDSECFNIIEEKEENGTHFAKIAFDTREIFGDNGNYISLVIELSTKEK